MSTHRDIAELIRRGLETPGVVEDSEQLGAVRDGSVRANTVGLALIARCGITKALRLSAAAADEDSYTEDIADALACDRDFIEQLAEAHMLHSAGQIAERLLEGTFEAI